MNIIWTLCDAAQLSRHAAQWDSLNEACQRLPFLETAFLEPLLEEFGGQDCVLALGQVDGRLLAGLIVRRLSGGRWVTAQPSQLPLGPVLLHASLNQAEVCDSLVRALPGFKLSLGLTQIDPAQHPRPVDSPRFKTLDYIETAWVDVEGSFADYWAARGKNLRQNLRKQRNKLAAEGAQLVLEEVRDVQSMSAVLLDYGRLEAASWKADLGTAIEPDNAQGRFYLRMLQNFAAKNRASAYRYTLNERVVAMDLCIESDDVLVILKTTYDGSDKNLSPAFLMREEQFQRLFETGRFSRIEFFGKVMEWHTRWTDNSRTLYHCNNYRYGWLPRLLALRSKLLASKSHAAATRSEAS